MRVQMPCSGETSETGGKSATRCSKFWVRSSENLEFFPVSPVPRVALLPRARITLARIMYARSFTFKYVPNIIQEFCMHVAARDMCAWTE
jgi:hypothetical protein